MQKLQINLSLRLTLLLAAFLANLEMWLTFGHSPYCCVSPSIMHALGLKSGSAWDTCAEETASGQV